MSSVNQRLPGETLNIEKMPGHWLLARMGKRVLRPGGIEMTNALLTGLDIGTSDQVVEFAPGLGVTARLILDKSPEVYTGVERDEDAAAFTMEHLRQFDRVSMKIGSADSTGLPDQSATIVVGEAMLTMNPQAHKEQIIAEAFRILKPGGLYGIHELCVTPNGISPDQHAEIEKGLSAAINVGARPLTQDGWRSLMTDAGFHVLDSGVAPMHLLEPKRIVQDEGLAGALRILKNVMLNSAARKRISKMKRTFKQYHDHLAGIYVVSRKPAETPDSA